MGKLKSQKTSVFSRVISALLLMIYSWCLCTLGTLNTSQTLALADTTPSPSPSVTSLSLSEFDSICKDVLTQASQKGFVPVAGTNQADKIQKCKAVKAAMEAAGIKDILWGVWAGVAGVCAAACAASFVGFSNQYICMGLTAAAGITDAALTKQFTSAMAALGGVGAGFMVNQATKPNPKSLTPEEEAAGKKPTTPAQKDWGACVQVGIAAFQVYSNKNGANKSRESAEKNLASAKNLSDSSGTAVSSDPNSVSAGGSSGSTTAIVGSTSATVGTSTSDSTSSTQNTCSAAQSSKNAGLSVSCALASDATLPRYVGTQKFADDFKKSSGQDFGEFLGKATNPAQAIMTAAGGALSASQSAKLGAALQEMEQKISEKTDFMYSSGGGGGRSPGSEDPSINDLMAGVMQQFMPKNGQEEDKNQGVEMVIFANKKQSPAAVAENPTLSIFDRITYRYYFVGQKMIQEGQ